MASIKKENILIQLFMLEITIWFIHKKNQRNPAYLLSQQYYPNQSKIIITSMKSSSKFVDIFKIMYKLLILKHSL